jgi:hypothetical protein
MATQGWWKPVVYTVMLSGVVLGSIFLSGQSGVQRPSGNVMNDTRFTVRHVRLATDKPFEEGAKAFERQLGTFDPSVRKAAPEDGDTEAAKAKIAAMAGSSGFMLFGTQDHGALLRLAGQRRKAIQYTSSAIP